MRGIPVKKTRRMTGKALRHSFRGPNTKRSYLHGYERGYAEGMQKGKDTFDEPFHGTSIIIPTFNQVDYLIQCISSIEAYTTEPYEIIVVDNASTDETDHYLQQRSGQIRYTRMDDNRGFSGGVNQGLMMAKGKTIVILNNDTLVTPGWLGNMLRCLYSDSRIGAVGPVTNYISGEQQIEVPYNTVEQMWEYAAAHNVPDEGKWRETERIVGFCLLLRRELLQCIGYFDEGFRIGNYEDEDWIIRIRLSGRSLVIAGDAFIHHFGSVSMKKLGQQFEAIQDHNEHYYRNKWGNPYAWVKRVGDSAARAQGLRSACDFYPSHVLISDQTGKLYFLYEGQKYALSGKGEQFGMTPVVLSKLDVLSIPEGYMSEEEISALLQMSTAKSPADGQLVGNAGGALVYQWYRGAARPFASVHTLQRWHMENRDKKLLPLEMLQSVPEGILIIAPPYLQNSIL